MGKGLKKIATYNGNDSDKTKIRTKTRRRRHSASANDNNKTNSFPNMPGTAVPMKETIKK